MAIITIFIGYATTATPCPKSPAAPPHCLHRGLPPCFHYSHHRLAVAATIRRIVKPWDNHQRFHFLLVLQESFPIWNRGWTIGVVKISPAFVPCSVLHSHAADPFPILLLFNKINCKMEDLSPAPVFSRAHTTFI